MSKHPKELPMSGALRQKIQSQGESLYRVSKDSGVPYAVVHRFVVSRRAISMHALDTLCNYLGLRLTK
jgi:hypothetical protein